MSNPPRRLFPPTSATSHPTPPPYSAVTSSPAVLDEPAPARTVTGHFNNAHHFVLNNPNMYDITTNIHYHLGANTLQLMIPFVMEGAEFDSFERDPPPRCHPGTRQDIMNAILSWRHNENRLKRLLWLNGSAGVGKSAVIQTLAEAEAEASTCNLGATLFFSRSNKRYNSNRILATIAYQLAVKDETYRAYITERMAADPRLLGKSMPEQFKILITQPFGEMMLWKGPDACSIYLDGLDECSDEEAQCRLIELISTFTLQYPQAPLVWIIASRPEHHLQTTFSRDDIVPSYHEITIPINSDESCRDVERYLRIELTKIKDKHPDLIPPESQWPTESQFLEIATAASGLFVFVCTIIPFIGAESTAQSNPITQLKLVLAVIRRAKLAFNLEESPLATLDLLYHQIMSNIPPAIISVTKQILGFAIFDLVGISGLVEGVNILGLDQHTVYKALAKLSSVINVPKPEDAVRSNITVLHKSFTDYLQDSKRSGEYCIDIMEFHTTVWRCFFRILCQFNQGDKKVVLSWNHPNWQEYSDTFYMVQCARLNWSRMLLTTHDKFRMYSKRLRISVSISEQLEVFNQIAFDKLERYVSTITSHDLVNVCLWIRYYSPPEIRDSLFTYTAEGSISDCSRVLNRVIKDRISYELVWWPRQPFIKHSLIGSWGQLPPHEWRSQFHPDVQILGTTDELVEKLRADEKKNMKAVVLGGWYAVVEERELAEDGSVKLYIFRLSERI